MKIATPVSTIFNATPLLADILELSDVLEVREYSRPVNSLLPRIYHCDWSIIDEWSQENVQEIANMILNNNPELVTFHVNSCYQKPPVVDGMFQPSGRKFSEKELLDHARANLQKLDAAVARAFQKGIENTNYYPSGAYEMVTDPEFLTALATEFGFQFLLDMAHAQVTAINKKITLEEYLSKLDLAKVVQFHISRPDKNPQLARDAHEVLEDDDWELVEQLMARCPNLKYMTLEYYKNDEKLLAMLKKLREILA